MPATIKSITKALREQTGAKGIFFLGAPEPKAGGQIIQYMCVNVVFNAAWRLILFSSSALSFGTTAENRAHIPSIPSRVRQIEGIVPSLAVAIFSTYSNHYGATCVLTFCQPLAPAQRDAVSLIPLDSGERDVEIAMIAIDLNDDSTSMSTPTIPNNNVEDVNAKKHGKKRTERAPGEVVSDGEEEEEEDDEGLAGEMNWDSQDEPDEVETNQRASATQSGSGGRGVRLSRVRAANSLQRLSATSACSRNWRRSTDSHPTRPFSLQSTRTKPVLQQPQPLFVRN